jgi:hypothetical protein
MPIKMSFELPKPYDTLVNIRSLALINVSWGCDENRTWNPKTGQGFSG